MCIIAVSKKGVRQPSLKQLRNMYSNNPDGAWYMYAKDGQVYIHKGFMTWEDFERSVKSENFTKDDPVVYHFRISTQAGVRPEMTHPFPLTTKLSLCEKLDLKCPVGLAHNGIISMTSFTKEVRYSDTAYFITWYMTKLLRNKDDISDPSIIDMIDVLTNSKWAIMNGKTGEIATVGNFVNSKGLLFSNESYKSDYVKWTKAYTYDPKNGWKTIDDYSYAYGDYAYGVPPYDL